MIPYENLNQSNKFFFKEYQTKFNQFLEKGYFILGNEVQEFEKEFGKNVGVGRFGADMKVSLLNDGPVTIIIDSKHKE